MNQLTTKTKLIYGLGFSARGIKDGLFQLFLFFYFSQVLGLDAALAGTASVISLLFDAISDPLIGLISDKWKSVKWGRRHPFMFVSALPLGLFTWLLFLPPTDLGQQGLFLWLTGFSILVRLALTFFVIPHMSLGAEMTNDYKERTTVTSYRIMFAALVSPIVIIGGLFVFFKPTEVYSHGMFNVEAYPKFAMICAILMIISILWSTWGTRDLIPTLPQFVEDQSKEETMSTFSALGSAIKMKSFWTLVSYVMITYVALGIGVIFTTYFSTYFFEFTEIEMAALPIGSAIGGILGLFIAPNLGQKFDKKWAIALSATIYGIFFSMPFILRLLGIFPDNDSSSLLPTYVATLVVAYTFLWTGLSLASSMMADVADEFELLTGTRQEGLFFSTMSFAYKCTTGLGAFIAGLLLTWIAFPKKAELGEVSDDAIRGLGYIGGPILLCLYFIAIIFITKYPITRERYDEIRTALMKKSVSNA